MGDLLDGRYLIVFASPSAPPPSPVGANEQGATSPVVVGGKDNVWTAKFENGKYTLILEQTGPRWLSKAGENEVFVALMPLPGEWEIQKQKDGTYSIEVPTGIMPGLYWNLTSTELGTPVTLARRDFPPLWNFIPVFDK